ncbi:MAG: transcription antitermination factor NusB [Thermincola sp.]|jgi:N utilization substance protein B|nr:transcription antitermination factor NusB [Thermincola sp.]MDT3703650.1 transcription antitermination factor NusB [Thermincola sp.]
MSRRAAREAALQALFQIDLGKVDLADAVQFVTEENNLNEEQNKFVTELVSGVLHNISGINNIIKDISIDWNLERMAAADRNILRLALFEMCFSEGVPGNVAVNEAIELGKTFSTAESGKFINGILGKIMDNLDKYKVIKSNAGV